jgi:sec-independent protein translocase protein TatA
MEIAVVLIVALLILGPKKLPAAGRSLGEGIRGFKETITGARADLDDTKTLSAETEPAKAEHKPV